MKAENKLTFLKYELCTILEKTDLNSKALFGKMNLHQMVEHLVYSVRIASGKEVVKALYEDEMTTKMHTFLMSDKDFRNNTPNPNLPKEPEEPKTEKYSEAIALLLEELNYFEKVYKEKPDLKIQNAFFGLLNFEEQVQLLYKHAKHHLRQFGVVIE